MFDPNEKRELTDAELRGVVAGGTLGAIAGVSAGIGLLRLIVARRTLKAVARQTVVAK